MATIVVNTDNSLEENLSYPQLDKSILEAQMGKTTRCKNVSELMQNLNS